MTIVILSSGAAMAQSCTPLYRRIPFGKPVERSVTPLVANARGLQVHDTAGWKQRVFAGPVIRFIRRHPPQFHRNRKSQIPNHKVHYI